MPIHQLYDTLLALMRMGAAIPFRNRYDTLGPVIDRVFDLSTVLRTSVGMRWGALGGPAQQALHDAFRRFTIATYVANFDKFEGERFEISPTPRPSGADQIVQSRIVRSTGDPVRLDYVMRQAGGGWRVVDVLLDGTISRVAVQRSDFRGLLEHGDATALIARLQRKAADLSGGSILDS